MHLSQLEKISQTSFSLLKAKLQQDTKRKRIEQRNTIKINRRKLPSDFFKGSVEKNLTRKVNPDPYFDKFCNEKTLFLLKQPQTQRKIQSYQCLPSSDPDHMTEFQYGRSSGVRIKDQASNILYRKFLEKEVEDIKTKTKKSRFDKSIDCVKPKSLRQRESEQKLEYQTPIKKNSLKPTASRKEKSNASQFEGSIDMGCTFGCGFKNKVDFSLKNSVMLKENQQNSGQFIIDEQLTQDQSFRLKDNSEKKQSYEKSTEQSQFFDSSKSKQNSPIRQKNRKRILKLAKQANQYDKPKSLSTSKYNNNQDFALINDMNLPKQKFVFTAEEKQRKIRNRINSSSTDNRTSKLRKDKKIENLNLPKIGKVVSFQINVEN